jgi:hypothetical protein
LRAACGSQSVIPVKTGIQAGVVGYLAPEGFFVRQRKWIPASAGMTESKTRLFGFVCGLLLRQLVTGVSRQPENLMLWLFFRSY